MNTSSVLFVVGLCIAFVVLVIVTMVFLRNRLLGKAFVTVIIDIFESGKYRIEYSPEDYTVPIDLIQLAALYIAKMDYVTANNPGQTRKAQSYLWFTLAEYDDYPSHFDIRRYRQHLATLEQMISLEPSLLEDEKKSVGYSDRFVVGLIRGNKGNIIANKFSVSCYKPNIYNSAVYLFCDVANRLSDSDLLIHCRTVTWYMSLRDEIQTGIMMGEVKGLTSVQMMNLAQSAVKMALEENKVMELNAKGL